MEYKRRKAQRRETNTLKLLSTVYKRLRVSIFSVLALGSEKGVKTCAACKSALSFLGHSYEVLAASVIITFAVEATC